MSVSLFPHMQSARTHLSETPREFMFTLFSLLLPLFQQFRAFFFHLLGVWWWSKRKVRGRNELKGKWERLEGVLRPLLAYGKCPRPNPLSVTLHILNRRSLCTVSTDKSQDVTAFYHPCPSPPTCTGTRTASRKKNTISVFLYCDHH